ncbi:MULTISPECIES: GNAT family N-acetyltransferase [Paenibacillus]|uniref:N-acetyltransferase YhbS n=1 Tax=Paenibacillus pabuli TaxID=1472 RepID=A0A855YAX2_9BACL|nr:MULTISPECIES: GNAT family N-acetyltransferase [Paenibacillus]PWW40832.1 putative N-acetyltransferase YhbS [Paenibacillus pabuli]PXW11956.1 putative N-acetyltransferase YhbS [Paenibacillus taichungensis]RAI97330.1 putative N-acetyltransferase YhbS [Paenibacillus pabuli]
MNIHIRLLDESDPVVISQAFQEQGWVKSVEQYIQYLAEQQNGERVTLVAELAGAFAGYVNVLWNSYYPSFNEQGIPEINDFNVLIKYQRQGIGSRLMDRAEEVIQERTDTAGIGVGVFSDYGKAQILYARRGYIPDGQGIHKHDRYLKWGDETIIDDDVVLYLTKKLS